jgi:hypothetical protein
MSGCTDVPQVLPETGVPPSLCSNINELCASTSLQMPRILLGVAHRLRAPNPLQVLTEKFAFDRKGEVPPGQKPYWEAPYFSWDKVGLLWGCWAAWECRGHSRVLLAAPGTAALRRTQHPRHHRPLASAVRALLPIAMCPAHTHTFYWLPPVQGYLHIFSNYRHVHEAQRFPEVPRLTQIQKEVRASWASWCLQTFLFEEGPACLCCPCPCWHRPLTVFASPLHWALGMHTGNGHAH